MLTVDLFSVYLMSRVDTVIRLYIEVYFTFGLPGYVRYIEEFAKSRFVISRFYSIHFTVILAGTLIFVRCIEDFVVKWRFVKGPLKYLVAKLHGCYPGANSLPVSQNFFARFFRRRSVADSSRCLTFLLRCNKHKKLFLLTFFLLMFFFTVTTCEWCLYFLNLAVLLENFIHVRAY